MLVQLEDKTTRALTNRGLPKDMLRARPFPLEQHLITIESKVDGIKTRRVPKISQILHLEKFMQHPFVAPQIISISSFPNDGKAKMLAAYMMQTAYNSHIAGRFRLTKNRQLPLWHTLYGGFYDELRDGKKDEKPSLLVLSNITHMSTQVKLEKLRDLLEKYNDIPRIIVSTNEDPITLANTKLLISVNTAFYLATARKVDL